MAQLKTKGWSVTINQLNGRISIYRIGHPGSIEIPALDGFLTAVFKNDYDDIVKIESVETKHLERTAP